MQRIGRYEVLDELGRGSMGAVYKARDPHIGRTVAIKIILTANLTAEDLEHYRQRFRREAQAAGQMAHPGIITIHDIAEDEGGQPFLVMEFIEGTSLDRLLAGPEPLPVDRALDLGIQIADALDYAHQRGVIHRDVKPANILITSEGRAKIADFGIAKLPGIHMTQAGQLMGTPAFMAPEQFSGAAVDARSDLFSLGAMLYWMLTGEKPFGGESLTVVSFRVVYTSPAPARQLNTALPPDVDVVLSRCLAKNPDDRYASCRELAADLKALREGRPVTATPLPLGPSEQAAAKPMDATMVATQPITAEPTRHAIPTVGVPVAVTPATFWTRRRKIAAAVAVLLFLLLAGYIFWPGTQEVTPVTSEPAAEPPAAKPSTTKRTTARPAAPAPSSQPTAQPAEKEPTPAEILRRKGEEILREKAEEILDQQKKKKPAWSKGKGRRK